MVLEALLWYTKGSATRVREAGSPMRHALAVVLALVLAAAAGALPARSESDSAPAPKPPLAVVRLGTDHPFCTGFWIGGKNAYIVTAGHCALDEDVTKPFHVWLTDGTQLSAELAAWSRLDLGLDDYAMFAVTGPAPKDWTPTTLDCGTILRLGDHVTMDSFPGVVQPYMIHSEGTVTIDGLVTFPDGPWQMPVYTVTMPVGHGSSGAPVFGADGRVVAIAVGSNYDQGAWGFLQPIQPVCQLLHLSST